ncbi:hypothetical protein R5R35_007188 [Gryllus longicercus]|uniref:Cns1/TTC4 wheel domain-containing protein n=1 Tax=Gryllus longicercus TaxID=2509291 RepID=A0AAN9VLL5_9ORTH
MKEESLRNKRPMSDEERQQLAEQLDKELDDYINSLPKTSYTDGWPEDRWEEEMEKHPFFMTKSPSQDAELPPLLEGIQQLKYDEEENTPEELAATYKEDGNFNFKCKKYRVAVISYTEGIRQNCNNKDLNAQLYNNRAASHFFLKNYRSCLRDCQEALKLKKPYVKAQTRLAQCFLFLHLHDDCIQACDDILMDSPSDKEILDLRNKAVNSKKVQEREKRKLAAAQRKDEVNEKALLKALQDRNIQIYKKGAEKWSLKDLEPQSPEAIHSKVHLENNRLVWPVIFLYPEYQTTDFIQEFSEDSTFEDQLNVMFEVCPEWDVEEKYKPPHLQVYFENQNTGRLCSVPSKSTLLQALSDKRYFVIGGTPSFIIFVTGSDTEKKYVNS